MPTRRLRRPWTTQTEAAAAPEEPPPLPFHTIEGVGGGAITPMAYLVNPGDECHVFGKPAVALTYVGLGQKNLSVISVTETVFQRVELGYAADRLGLGDAAFRHQHGYRRST